MRISLGIWLDAVFADILLIPSSVQFDLVSTIGAFDDNFGWSQLILVIPDKHNLVGKVVGDWKFAEHVSNY